MTQASEEATAAAVGYDAEAFFLLTAEMREAQKHYFRTRSQEWLQRSKELERLVDKMVKSRLDPNRDQRRMFDG